MILHLPFNFDYFYKGTKSVDDFRRAIREDEQKMKSAINEGLLYVFSNGTGIAFREAILVPLKSVFSEVLYLFVNQVVKD